MTLNAELPTQAADITWPVEYARIGCSAFDVSELEEGSDEYVAVIEDQERFEAQAVELLWMLTNRVFGTQLTTVRPVRVDPRQRVTTFEGLGPHSAYYEMGVPGVGYGWVSPMVAGMWHAMSCGVCGGLTCVCDEQSLRAIHLLGPVQEVESVYVDGALLAPTAYRVDNRRTLVRIDGESWPARQNLERTSAEEDTFVITYRRGVEVPVGGRIAAGRLACELAKAAAGDDDCALPSRVQSVSRQGVTIDMLTEFSELEKGALGIWEIDSWVAAVNRPRSITAVTSPESRLRSRWRS